METVFISKLKPFLDAVAGQMELYVPKKAGEHYVYSRYNPSAGTPVEFNNIRTCMPIKEFLFPLRELAAIFPESAEPEDVKPFAVFGLKDCDLRSIEILDKVFLEEEFEDSFYVARREKMFILSSDCFEPGESCCCTLFGGQSYAEKGFDLNLAKVKNGFIVEAGSDKGRDFLQKHKDILVKVPSEALAERDSNRAQTRKQLEENNAEYTLDAPVNEIMENSPDSDVFDVESQKCVECQACTRVCPTCHCFYLYDAKQKDYFAKMKMWDGCMRIGFAAVAGGANPRKMLGDRIKHRLMHKFSFFFDRYGIDMCVGCGRCIDADSHKMDIRVVLKKLSEEPKGKRKKKAKVGK
ncbi:MAG: 4Fe-4S dicluster domain-containing protein [Planctomycetota bacterium]|jgi:ferredoxin